jgi:hypothetical protein
VKLLTSHGTPNGNEPVQQRQLPLTLLMFLLTLEAHFHLREWLVLVGGWSFNLNSSIRTELVVVLIASSLPVQQSLSTPA